MIDDNDAINLQKYELIKDWIVKWAINKENILQISTKSQSTKALITTSTRIF